MNQTLKDAIIVFLRACFSAGVGAAVEYITHFNFLTGSVSGVQLGEGVVIAFITGILMFAGTWLRNINSTPVSPVAATPGTMTVATNVKRAGPHFMRTKSWADYLPI